MITGTRPCSRNLGRRSASALLPRAELTPPVWSTAQFLDVWSPFTAARHIAPAVADNPVGLWSDGVHLTELGDTVLLGQAERLLAEHRVIKKLLDYPLLEREAALASQQAPTSTPRSSKPPAARRPTTRIWAGHSSTSGAGHQMRTGTSCARS